VPGGELTGGSRRPARLAAYHGKCLEARTVRAPGTCRTRSGTCPV